MWEPEDVWGWEVLIDWLTGHAGWGPPWRRAIATVSGAPLGSELKLGWDGENPQYGGNGWPIWLLWAPCAVKGGRPC